MKNKTVVLNEHLSEEYKNRLNESGATEENEKMPETDRHPGIQIKNVRPHRKGLFTTVFSVAVIVIGLVLIICGGIISSNQGKPHGQYSEKLFAEISNVYPEKNEKTGEIEYYPEVHYFIDSKEYVEKSSKAYEKPTFSGGQQIEIIYNPDKPTNFQILTNSDESAGNAYTYTGIFLMVLGLVVFLVKFRSDN